MRKGLICLLSLTVLAWGGRAALAAHSDTGCHDCHVPHNAGDPSSPDNPGVPLWNPALTVSKVQFDLYKSKTFDALGTDIGQPDGPSRVCLGCHDGSYPYIKGTANEFTSTDLARSHPISFTYNSALAKKANGKLNDPAVALSTLPGGRTIAQDLLDINGKMQCTSCHDIHSSGIGQKMLRWDWSYTSSPKTDVNMCKVCHNK
jgi:hypothetical protein